MLIVSLSGASLLEKKTNLLRAMKYFDAAAKIHAGADANQKIYFHRPNFKYLLLTFSNVSLFSRTPLKITVMNRVSQRNIS